ncbi:unnamed protein product [Scytosiphon promiscuus]
MSFSRWVFCSSPSCLRWRRPKAVLTLDRGRRPRRRYTPAVDVWGFAGGSCVSSWRHAATVAAAAAAGAVLGRRNLLQKARPWRGWWSSPRGPLRQPCFAAASGDAAFGTDGRGPGDRVAHVAVFVGRVVADEVAARG